MITILHACGIIMATNTLHFSRKMEPSIYLPFFAMFGIFSSGTGGPLAAPQKQVEPMGIVEPITRCGGVGTLRQLRISNCDGRCEFIAGQVYECEMDFVPSGAAPSLSLGVDICIQAGLCWNALEVEIPNSSVQPGLLYTAKYSIVPNDIFAGSKIIFMAHIYRSNVFIEEICVSAEVDLVIEGDITG